MRFPSMLKNTLRTLVHNVFDKLNLFFQSVRVWNTRTISCARALLRLPHRKASPIYFLCAIEDGTIPDKSFGFSVVLENLWFSTFDKTFFAKKFFVVKGRNRCFNSMLSAHILLPLLLVGAVTTFALLVPLCGSAGACPDPSPQDYLPLGILILSLVLIGWSMYFRSAGSYISALICSGIVILSGLWILTTLLMAI